MIVGKNISKHFGENGLDSTDITLKKGEFIGISGASGCGKTTLLNILTGMLSPDSGSISINNADLSKMSAKKRTALRGGTIGYMMQGSVLIPELTVWQNILLPAKIAGKNTDKAKALCEKLGITNIMGSYPADISGGEYRRVMLARILLADTPIFIADEPTSNLDEESATIVREMISEAHRKGVSIITATHDSALLAMADSVVHLST